MQQNVRSRKAAVILPPRGKLIFKSWDKISNFIVHY